jgi:CRP-like cAMP-binding protein
LAEAFNQFIDRLPERDRDRLLAVCERVELVLSEVICLKGTPATDVYFPTVAFVSLLSELEDHPSLEVGMVGREGMVGVGIALGMHTVPLRALVQGPGACWRVSAAAFRRELAASAALRSQVDRYTYVLMSQMATSAACLRFHLIGPRLARWLLMSQDCAHADQFQLTHEFLACMLGVRRVGVTVAAGVLQRQGLIAYRRGLLSVLDRTGLEAMACSCYATGRGAYREALD